MAGGALPPPSASTWGVSCDWPSSSASSRCAVGTQSYGGGGSPGFGEGAGPGGVCSTHLLSVSPPAWSPEATALRGGELSCSSEDWGSWKSGPSSVSGGPGELGLGSRSSCNSRSNASNTSSSRWGTTAKHRAKSMRCSTSSGSSRSSSRSRQAARLQAWGRTAMERSPTTTSASLFTSGPAHRWMSTSRAWAEPKSNCALSQYHRYW
mmetsp:Transcript_62343/g.168151  ORF Transcript_62343/g.168151 Transcript_62343/m.168151 type:complete len:208 (-) Transcript_62343:717-1340(-)